MELAEASRRNLAAPDGVNDGRLADRDALFAHSADAAGVIVVTLDRADTLLISSASIIARAAFGLLTGALLSTGVLTEAEALLVVLGPFAVIATIGQFAVAYFVARAVVRRGLKKPSGLATA